MQRYIFRHRIILKKVTFNVTVLVTVFKSDEKCDDSIFLNTVTYSIMQYGDASGINSIEVLYLSLLIMNKFLIFL